MAENLDRENITLFPSGQVLFPGQYPIGIGTAELIQSEILCICGHVMGAHREGAWECGNNCPCDEAVPAIAGLYIIRRDLDYPWPTWHSWPWDGEAARRWANRYLPEGASW